jgi:large-conductance mechanosensitive channel
MDPESQRFEKIELKLSEHEEHLIKHDRQLTAIRNLLLTGMQIMVNIETKVEALTDSHTRLYGMVQQLAEAQKQTEISLKAVQDALKRFLDRSGNGHGSTTS